MAKKLQTLLGNDHPLFIANIADLERASGNSGIDVKLIADVTEKAHAVMRSLGLDPADTTTMELYKALDASVGARRAEELLEDTSFVLIDLGDGPVSFNLHDVVENYHHELTYDDRVTDHAQRHLRMEIVKRYAEHERTNEKTVKEVTEQVGIYRESDSDYPASTSAAGAQVPHILAIGDIITDAFIKLSEDHAESSTDEKGYKRLTFELGAKLPYDQVDIVQAVECSPNAAVSMTRLGLSTSLMSWLGNDGPGQEMIDYLKLEGVGTDDLVVEDGMKSNYHYVLRYGADRTKLQRFEDYSYQWQDPSRTPDWVYLGVLGEKTWPLHEALLKYLDSNPSIKLIFQPGMYHLMWEAEKVAPFYKRAELVIMNREEAAQVTGKDRESIPGLMQALHDLGVQVAVVTDGADGAYASDGSKILFMRNYPDPQPPYDRTGAGDAFASTIAAALALGEPLETALLWAPINSMSVVQKLGAQAGLLHRDEIERYLAEAPEDYVPKELN